MIQNIKIKIKKLHPDAKIPTYGTSEAAGFDIYSVEDVIILPHEVCPIKTGIAMELPAGKVLFVKPRSGMGMRGGDIYGGVVDSDYRGEIKAITFNGTEKNLEIKKGDRVAQGVIFDYYKADFEEAENLDESQRGEGWNHSTGR